eukprot:6251820-Lingulodinium_polyedra.AAC.1
MAQLTCEAGGPVASPCGTYHFCGALAERTLERASTKSSSFQANTTDKMNPPVHIKAKEYAPCPDPNF